jgi:hypothetical protein
MLVFIRAWEGLYQGLHGIEDLFVVEVSDDENEAISEINDYGLEAGEELIYGYGLEEEYFGDTDDYDENTDISDSCYYEDIGWSAYKIKADVTLSEKELNEKACSLGAELFIEEYCEKEPII